jgi:hypothetical protein
LANESLAFSLFAKTLVPPAESCSGAAIEASETMRWEVVAVVVEAVVVEVVVVESVTVLVLTVVAAARVSATLGRRLLVVGWLG